MSPAARANGSRSRNPAAPAVKREAEKEWGRCYPVIDLAGRDIGDHDGAGVHAGGAALAFGTLRH